MKIAIFLQARLDSKRLPKKVIMPIKKDEILINFLLKRLLTIKSKITNLIILTCKESLKTLKEKIITDKKISIFSGSKENVLDRFHKASLKYKPKIIIRVTADNPFTSPNHIKSILSHHIKKKADLSHYNNLPLGTAVEIINTNTLTKAKKEASNNYQLEHVTPYIYQNPKKFKIQKLSIKGICARPEIRLTVDTKQDIKIIKTLTSHCNHKSKLSSIIKHWDKIYNSKKK